MKLLVIVLALLSERYLIHTISTQRFTWFSSYFAIINQNIAFSLSWRKILVLLLVVSFPLLICWLSFYFLGNLFFGFIGFLLHLFVFYYCLGPKNPFYPFWSNPEEDKKEDMMEKYCVEMNEALFAIVFWYVVGGPLAILTYRLVSLCKQEFLIASLATTLNNILNWLPARITVFFFLLVGNFQKGIHFFIRMLLAPPEKNTYLLGKGGLLALGYEEDEQNLPTHAEKLMEHALLLYLVVLALLTLVAWL